MPSVTATKRVGRNLTEGPIFKGLMVFALPIILSNVIQQLYGMVDLSIAGRYVGSIGTVGVNTGGEMADFILPVAIGFSSAGQIYVSQLVGAGRYDKVKSAIGTLFSLILLIAVILSVCVIAFCNPILQLLNCPQEALGQARAYMIITAIGFPFVFGYNAVCGILRGMGESKRPLYFIIVAASINIFADLLLVVVIPLEAAGTAIATVLSQIASFTAAFSFMYRSRDRLGLKFDRTLLGMDREAAGVMVKLAVPQVTRSLMVRFGLLWVNANINTYGTEVSATNGVGNKIQKFLEVFMQGVDTAAASMIGQNLGARKYDRAKKIPLCALSLTMAFAVACSVLGLLFPKQIFGIFSDDPLVLALGVVYLEFMVIHFFSTAFIGPFQAMVNGSGFVSLGFVVGILDGLLCKIGLSLIFVPLFENAAATGIVGFFISQIPVEIVGEAHSYGYLGYFLAIACSRILPGLICFGYYVSGRWKSRKLLVKGKKSEESEAR